MHPAVRPYSFDALLKGTVAEDAKVRTAWHTLKSDADAKQLAANRKWEDVEVARAAGNSDLANKLERDWKDMTNAIKKAKDKLVARADVILSTLSSSSNSLMEKF